MQKRFHFPISRVSDALNGIIALTKQSSILQSLNVSRKGTKTKAILALAIVCFFWGTTWVASKEGVRHMPALQLAGIRQSIAGFIYVLFFIIKGAAFPKGKEWWSIIVLSCFNFVLSNGLSTWGVQYISAGLGSIIGAIFPLWLVLFGLFGSQTAMKRKTVLGLTLGFTGICVIFYQHLHDFFNAEFRFGILLSLFSTWSWAIGTLYTKKEAVKFNPYFALGLQMVLAGPFLYGISYFTNNAVAFAQIPWQSWAAIAYLVLFGSAISFVAYLYALQNLPTEQVSIYAYINPVVALLTGAIIFGEMLTPAIVAGVLITLYGVYLVNRSVIANRPPEQQTTNEEE